MSPILFILHDIGGAQLLYSYIVTQNIDNYYILAEGPGLYPFAGIIPESFLTREDASNLITEKKCSAVITSTSWASTLELDYIKLSKSHGVETISFIDHWVNYRERFHYPKENWERNLPDVIWVHDLKSFKLANEFFPNKKIELKENYYLLLNLVKLKKTNLSVVPNSFLVLTEPISEHYGKKLGYDEYDSIDLFWNKLDLLKLKNCECKITIRPHPSEREVAFSKYGKYLEKGATLSSEVEIFNDLYAHESVVGVDTIAMYYAAQLKRKVYCSIPTKEGQCSLPINDVIYLRDKV